MALLLVTAALSVLPAADAHQCSGSNCGSCPQGATEYHQHADSSGKLCQSGAGFSQSADQNGARQSPGSGVFWTLVALVGASGLVMARRG